MCEYYCFLRYWLRGTGSWAWAIEFTDHLAGETIQLCLATGRASHFKHDIENRCTICVVYVCVKNKTDLDLNT